MQESLKQKGVEVQVDPEHGILRLPEEILFESGKYTLTTDGDHAVEVLAEELALVIPCYAGKADREQPEGFDCGDHWHPGRLDTILVEGHTDSARVTLGGRARKFEDNWELSSLRAIETYKALAEGEHGARLRQEINRDGESVIGVSAYAYHRPIPGEASARDPSDPKNRRIDLRFVMAPPKVGSSAPVVLEKLVPSEGGQRAGS